MVNSYCELYGFAMLNLSKKPELWAETCQIESFTACLSEFLPLFREHFKEIASFQDSLPLDESFSGLVARDSVGQLLFVTVRYDGEPVGYYCGVVAYGSHHTSLTCFTDAFYLKPEYRGSGSGARMFRFIEKELKKVGVKEWRVDFNHEHDLSGFLHSLKFSPHEVTYCKVLEV